MWGRWKTTRDELGTRQGRAAHPAGRDLVAPPEHMLAILVVCTANMCRSPFVAAMLQRELDFAGVPALVSSAGSRAELGTHYDERIRRLLDEQGLRPDAPAPRALSERMLSTLGRDLVIVMTAEHLREVASIEPGALARTFPLRVLASLAPVPSWWQALDQHHAGRDLNQLLATRHTDDVPDPYGQQGPAFVRSIEELATISMVSARFIASNGSATN